MSEKKISHTDTCALRCSASMFDMAFRSDADKKEFLLDCKATCTGTSRLGKYLGCYSDSDEYRDLNMFIGTDLST